MAESSVPPLRQPLMGNAAALPSTPPPPPVTAAQPPRHAISRNARPRQVLRLIADDLLIRYRLRIVLAANAIVLLSITMICIFLWNVFAEFTFFHRPCDQPLHSYLLVFVFVAWLGQRCSSLGRACTLRVQIAMKLLALIPWWLHVLWGLQMLNACKTCKTTNPGLFYPTTYLIYGQMVVTILVSLFWFVGICCGGFRAAISFIESLTSRLRPGCQKAVRELPKVAIDSPELFDHDDGKVMECPICQESLGGGAVVVRTKCEHYFHEDCLTKWCQNHLECPLCRAEIGDPDERGALGQV